MLHNSLRPSPLLPFCPPPSTVQSWHDRMLKALASGLLYRVTEQLLLKVIIGRRPHQGQGVGQTKTPIAAQPLQ